MTLPETAGEPVTVPVGKAVLEADVVEAADLAEVVEVVALDRSAADVLSDDADADALWSRLAGAGEPRETGPVPTARPAVGEEPAPRPSGDPSRPSSDEDSPRPMLRRAEPVIDAPAPTTPKLDLGDDIGSALAAELGIDLPSPPRPDAPRITRTMTASLSDRIRSSWPPDPDDDPRH
jgi:hypothetical protein